MFKRKFLVISVSLSSDPAIVNKYKAGYNDCVQEVTKYMHSTDFDSELKSKLESHLTQCLASISSVQADPVTQTQSVASQIPAQVGIPSVKQMPIKPTPIFKPGVSKTTELNNTVIKILPAAIQTQPTNIVNILPSSNGDFAVVLPQSGQVTSPVSIIPVKFACCSSMIPTAAVTSTVPANKTQSSASNLCYISNQNSDNCVTKEKEGEPEQELNPKNLQQEDVLEAAVTETSDMWRPW